MVMSKVAVVAAAMGMVAAAPPAVAQQRQPQGHQPPQGSDQRGGRPHWGGPMGGPPSPERMFAEMDSDRDGSVSKAEFTAFHERRRPMGRPEGGRMGPPPPQPAPRR